MKYPDKKFGVVVWDDAVGGMTGKAHEIQFRPERCHTFGWFLRSEAAGVLIAADWVQTDDSFRDVTFIPRGMVVEETPLTLSKKAGPKSTPSSTSFSSSSSSRPSSQGSSSEPSSST